MEEAEGDLPCYKPTVRLLHFVLTAFRVLIACLLLLISQLYPKGRHRCRIESTKAGKGIVSPEEKEKRLP